MLRLEFAGRKAYHGGNFSNILKFFLRRCLLLRGRSTLAHKSAFSSFVCQPGAVSQVSRGQLWHTNRLFRVLCARPALPPGILEGKNEKFLAHKSPKFEIVCHSSSIHKIKREIFGTQIAKIQNRVPLLTNLRRKMSNKRDWRRKGVICPEQSETRHSQNTFFTETGKEPKSCYHLLFTETSILKNCSRDISLSFTRSSFSSWYDFLLR